MALKLYNTLAREKQVFEPLGKKVLFYACGPTVYNYAHIGNLRTYVFEDVLRRYLVYKGFAVKQAMNLTDVDDKTIRDSQKQGVPLKDFTKKYEAAFLEDRKTLNMQEPEVWCRATEHVNEMVALVKTLEQNGFAYKSGDGSTYFSIAKFKKYGRLSNVSLDGLKSGARVAQDEYEKGSVSDFVLWKAWDEKDGNVFWETELGKGRPGWHLECSAMAMKHLGTTIDLHAGGTDLVFPHHENEIAQSEAATGKPFARFWTHAEHLMSDGRKMSKKLDNFYTLRDLLAKGFKPAGIRYFLLSSHYRQQQNLTMEALHAAENTATGLFEFKRRLEEIREGNYTRPKGAERPLRDTGYAEGLCNEFLKQFEKVMDDDLNTPMALAALFEFETNVNKLVSEKTLDEARAQLVLETLERVDSVLGLFALEERAKLALPEEKIRQMATEREAAKKAKDYAKADSIRAELKNKGIILEDTPNGPKWRQA
ncbi:TPA: cysteine--tRNA ligase [Candidatus Micrarchaeota archaeon]|nr:MAG: cysteine--tRNA ligase [Candidatus Micrarchaeota archaeon CG1_02_51_15]HII38639.1 cysteine--tRNA ligase [Candidatus Micrarchaeota archaeon]